MEVFQEAVSKIVAIQEIDHLTEKFYECVCFSTEHYPKVDQLKDLFYDAGRMVNNNFDVPLELTAQSYAQALIKQIEDSNVEFNSQIEISDITEVFGRMAQRISVFEYSSTPSNLQPWKRGVNYIQYVYINGRWLISSMIWSDEKDNCPIPESYLAG